MYINCPFEEKFFCCLCGMLKYQISQKRKTVQRHLRLGNGRTPDVGRVRFYIGFEPSMGGSLLSKEFSAFRCSP
jgi:hypothetical protein